MTDLKEIETQLITCDDALKKTTEILSHHNVETTRNNFQEALLNLRSDLDDQLRKIRKRDFEIAVVGREKAGKSSLLNAWIGFNLLPNERNRCTYTTTEIRSCFDISDQKYVIEYFSGDEFASKLEQMSQNTGVRGIDLLRQEEIDEIKKYAEEIEGYLDRTPQMRKFQNFDEVRDELKSAISKPGHARAVKKICIWTPKLGQTENVVLYDVPGYDSPITLHKEQTKAKIAQVDAILYAKQFCSPDLVDCEIEILKISDANNPYIKAKDKIIVALTNCDLANSAREYEELVVKNRKAWKMNDISESRIIPVCSLAESMQNQQTPEEEKAMKNLKDLNGGNSGFKELKEAVNQCILDSKFRIAVDRCNEMKNRIKDLGKQLIDSLKDKYQIDLNSEIKDSLNEDEMDKIYQEWWTQQWKYIHEDFQTYFNTIIRPRLSPDDLTQLNSDDIEFKKLYDSTIEETFKQIPASRKDRQALIYNSVMSAGIVSPKEGNTKIRTELSYEAINSLDKITIRLNVFLWQNIDKMIAWMRKRLWNLPEIREEVISKDEKLESSLMQRSFDSLIQRLARPATHIFLRFPRSKVERIRIMREYQMELLVIDKFMINGRLTERGLLQYLANGKHGKFDMDIKQEEIYLVSKKPSNNNLLENEETSNQSENKLSVLNKNSQLRSSTDSLNSVVPGPKGKKSIFAKLKSKRDTKEDYPSIQQQVIVVQPNEITEEPAKVVPVIPPKPRKPDSQFEKLNYSGDAENLTEIHTEIQADINEFLACMQNSIFYGSGIQRYYNQELDRIRRKFLDLENEKGRWSYYIFKYLRQKDSKIHIPAPKMDDEIKIRAMMLKNLRDINQIINKFSF